ncbi:hypothetical protein BraRD5C2_15870 [Bradyrhizobium sp. RD5-C2]|nr:hypothetical protein BraRD5C2_15870 [Bradyrhizobium sp. RD5-C2]
MERGGFGPALAISGCRLTTICGLAKRRDVLVANDLLVRIPHVASLISESISPEACVAALASTG